MRTVVLGEPPAELAALIERRRALGQDLYDEVWEGTYIMAPQARPQHGLVQEELAVLLRPLATRAGLVGTGPFNLGAPDNFRVPDWGYHRQAPSDTYVETAAIVVEVLSPDDETFNKFAFYAAHGVDEILIADPDGRTVRCWQLRNDQPAYDEVDSSSLLGVAMHDVRTSIHWPAR